MRATYWICLGLCTELAFGLAGCKDLDQCEDPGVTQACMCGADDGARVCQPEFVWSDCDCGAAVPDSGTTGGAGGTTGGAGGMTGGAGGTTGGAGGMTGGAGGMTGGMGGMTGGMGGDAPDAGGEGGMGGDPMPDRYAKCTVDTAEADCGAAAECRESDVPLGSFEPLTICAPSCAETDDCPAAPAGGAATLECVGGHCIFTCDVIAQDCPTGLTCSAKGALEFFCFTPAM